MYLISQGVPLYYPYSHSLLTCVMEVIVLKFMIKKKVVFTIKELCYPVCPKVICTVHVIASVPALVERVIQREQYMMKYNMTGVNKMVT
jgi:hypothetical protein